MSRKKCISKVFIFEYKAANDSIMIVFNLIVNIANIR